MNTINFKQSSIPAIGFGTFQLNGKELINNIIYAIDQGYRHIDTAQIYGNEEEVGQAIADTQINRRELFITTKVWIDNFTEKEFLPSVLTSLSKLKTDYVDLLLLHWPTPLVPLAETIAALNEVQKQGYTKYIGVSNFPIAQMAQSLELTKVPLLINQIEFHPLLQQPKVIEFAKAKQLGIIAHSSLAQGQLLKEPILITLAKKYEKDVPQIIFRWLYQLGIPSLIRSTHKERITSNAAIFDFEIIEEDMMAIAAIGDKAQRFINPVELAPIWDE
ncbi:D-xylose reductase III [Legionella busanensis]|uniref:D-xylose reductase III n=1 Tax=Legionella busanensis TaxID=190655 RepID=A0A378JL59_9GAMM|nr:aldo/keto reductase [Legionella busanensis]STX51471.1 D-xylose reductase III [Legionella busanensis]